MIFLNTLEKICDFLKIDVEELPFNLYTTDFTFPLSFYFDETDSDLIIFVTQDDGREKLAVVPKSNITSWEVIYSDDIRALTENDPEKLRTISHCE